MSGPPAAVAVDPLELRRVLAAFPTGVTAVAGLVGGEPVGLAANSFTSVSLHPPMVAVCVAHASTTWPRLRQARRLGVSVLAEHQEPVSRQLAARPADPADRFAAVGWQATGAGAVVLAEAGAWFDCSLEREVPAGDHDIVLLRVHDMGVDQAVAPLVFHGSRYRRLAEVGVEVPR